MDGGEPGLWRPSDRTQAGQYGVFLLSFTARWIRSRTNASSGSGLLTKDRPCRPIDAGGHIQVGQVRNRTAWELRNYRIFYVAWSEGGSGRRTGVTMRA